jgi:hypothetical protein
VTPASKGDHILRTQSEYPYQAHGAAQDRTGIGSCTVEQDPIRQPPSVGDESPQDSEESGIERGKLRPGRGSGDLRVSEALAIRERFAEK